MIGFSETTTSIVILALMMLLVVAPGCVQEELEATVIEVEMREEVTWTNPIQIEGSSLNEMREKRPTGYVEVMTGDGAKLRVQNAFTTVVPTSRVKIRQTESGDWYVSEP